MATFSRTSVKYFFFKLSNGVILTKSAERNVFNTTFITAYFLPFTEMLGEHILIQQQKILVGPKS